MVIGWNLSTCGMPIYVKIEDGYCMPFFLFKACLVPTKAGDAFDFD